MLIISEHAVDRTNHTPGGSSRIRRLTKILGGILFSTLLHYPAQTFGANVATGQSVTLTWNPSTDSNVAGYKVYYGVASGIYTNTVDVGNATNATISGLVAGVTYYFTTTALDVSGAESGFSNEVSYKVPTNTTLPPVKPVNQPPTLDPIADVVVYENAEAQAVTLAGISTGAPNEIQTLKISLSSSKPNLIKNLKINYTSPNNSGSLSFKPAHGATGTAAITVKVNDGSKLNNITMQMFTVTVLKLPGPEILSRLPDISASVGQNVSLAVIAVGIGPLNYQWKYNAKSITGATNATLVLSNLKTNQAGSYYVTVSNGGGSTNSTVAALTVYQSAVAALASVGSDNGNFSFNVSGSSGFPYVVEASPDMVNWDPMQTNSAPFTFVDTNAVNFQQRFYRTRGVR